MDFLQELPEQIFRDILLRVPYKSQSKIKELSKPAKEMMECFQFYQDRVKFGLAEKYICFLHPEEYLPTSIAIYDPVGQSCTRLDYIPFEYDKSGAYKIINVNHKIVVLGMDRDCIAKIWIYDLLSSTWKQAAEIPTRRKAKASCYGLGFASCASPEGSIYIAGGFEINGRAELRDAAVYKVDEDMWELLPEMHQEMGWCQGVFIEGMFYVIGTSNNGCQRFDPNTRVWTTIIHMSLPHPLYHVLYAFGRLIALASDKGIQQYDWEGNVWRESEPFPGYLNRVHVTVWYDRIFVLGYRTVSNNRRSYDHWIVYMYKTGATLSDRWISFDNPRIVTPVVYIASIEI